MNLYFHAASLGLPLLICVGTWQLADAQPSHPTILETPAALSTDEIVSHLVSQNLERSRALAAYKDSNVPVGLPRLSGSRVAEMTVEVNYKAPAPKNLPSALRVAPSS